ncbi:MarR family transcriptional regulator [Niallia taxi]|nr:MarR family transcriptional regulator [Niallia taxi]MCT2342991.1 MarR family transcriptional regulator [Niallia taxi]MDE5051246.1 MarR family transcriptional regulator [Niallia taxi]MED3964509.1 MarR family transcriptional regulator [Niallia taxi]WOD62312.1 MarR family transcriptional regulator [Niallia taxi]
MMNEKPADPYIESWLSLSGLQARIANELEHVLQNRHQLSLREFYVLLFLSKAPEKKLRLQQLQEMVGLSQSALSRLVTRLEAKNCGVLKRHICTDDRRGIYTSLTEYGEEKLKLSNETFSTTLADLLEQKETNNDLHTILQMMFGKE